MATKVGTSGPDSLVGSSTNDYLYGNAGNDTLVGLAGEDYLDGGTGADSMVGGTGNDIYIVDSLSDVIVENANEGTADLVFTTIGPISLSGHLANIENVTLSGSNARGVTGNASNNIITGSTWDDTIDGGDGNDTISANGGNDSLVGGSGNDSLSGATGKKTTFRGGSGSDTLVGGDYGDDILDGGTGADSMVGSTGNDTFYIDNIGDVVVEAVNEGTDWAYYPQSLEGSVSRPANVEYWVALDANGNPISTDPPATRIPRLFVIQSVGFNSTLNYIYNTSPSCTAHPVATMRYFDARGPVDGVTLPHIQISGSAGLGMSFELKIAPGIPLGYYSAMAKVVYYGGSSCTEFQPSIYLNDFTANEKFWICVVNQAPSIPADQSFFAVLNSLASFSISLNDPTTRIPSSVTATGLPPGMSLVFNNDPVPSYDGTYEIPTDILPKISGIPTALGTFSVQITATNPIGSETQTVAIEVGPSGPIATIVPGQVFTASKGVPFQAQILATGPVTGFSPPPAWSANQFPNWLTLSTAGVISGTPPAETPSQTISVTISGPDSVAIGDFSLEVLAPPPPTITVSPQSLTGFSTTAGAPSASQQFQLSGASLSTGIVVSAPNNFEVSIDNTNFSPSLTLPLTGSAVATTTAYARISASVSAGTASGNLTFTSVGASNQSISLSGTVNPALTRPVIFSVDMSIQIALGRFFPAFDRVEVRGVFNNFAGTELFDADGDGIYSGTLTISGSQGTIQNFKFFVPTNDLSWESGADRTFTLGVGNTAQILDVAHFNNVSTLPPVLLGVEQPSVLYVGGIAVSRLHIGDLQVFP